MAAIFALGIQYQYLEKLLLETADIVHVLLPCFGIYPILQEDILGIIMVQFTFTKKTPRT